MTAHKALAHSKAIPPAATVVLLRDTPNGFETLLLRRNAQLAFHGGAWVFPGGRLDAENYRAEALDDMFLVVRRAAVREAYEEAGRQLHPDDLLWLSHWTTPEGRPRRFATWFVIASGSDEAVQVDGGEMHDHRWFHPAQVLQAQRTGEIELL